MVAHSPPEPHIIESPESTDSSELMMLIRGGNMAKTVKTLGQLKKSGYEILPIREELRKNLIAKIKSGENIFPGIEGYENTVVPQLQNAILSGQDIILLGERGQAKSRIIRSLTTLLDEWTPVLDGIELPENPFNPISAPGKQQSVS